MCLRFLFKKMSIGKNIAKRCRELNIWTKELAELSKIPKSTLEDIVRDKAIPRADKIKKIALALHTTTDRLLFDDEDLDGEDELRILFNEVMKMPETEKRTVKETIRALILQNKSRELAFASDRKA